jgi:hypothetical protein
MAYILGKIGTVPNVPIQHFAVDVVEDLSEIKLSTVPMGSTAYVINTGRVYMLNSKKDWVIQPQSSGGGGGAAGDFVSVTNAEIDALFPEL